MQSELKEKVLSLLESVETYNQLLSQGLLKTLEANILETRIANFLKENIPSNSLLSRKFELENSKTVWRTAYPHQFLSPNSAVHYSRWLSLLDEFAKELNLNTKPQGELIIKQGSFYTAKKIIGNIFGKAEESIEIFDPYLDRTILEYFEDLVIEKPRIVVSLIGSNNDFGKKLLAATSDFNKEFNKKITTKLVEISNITTHYRVVILDRNEIYEFSHSIKDIGKKETIVKKIDGKENVEKLIETFSTLWSNL